ncbi:MAG: DUF4034 domain-containing protein [Myxococcota bacterium]
MSRSFIAALVILALLGAALAFWMLSLNSESVGVTTDPRSAYVQVAPSQVAPPPLEVPETLPLTPGEGQDEWGYPRRVADRVGFSALLRAERFEDLTSYVEALERAAEADFKQEFVVREAFEAFASGDPDLEAHFNAWVAAQPNSFAPYVARGTYYRTRGYRERGTRMTAETSGSQFAAMERFHRAGMADLQRALALEPRSISARIQQLLILQGGAEDAVFAEARANCPTCLTLWRTRMMGLRPLWGGSIEAMQALATDAQQYADDNPRLRILLGYPEWARCDTALRTRESGVIPADDGCDEALAHGDHWEFRETRAEHRLIREDFAGAREDVVAGLRQRPQHLELRRWQAQLAGRERDYLAAADSLVLAARVDRTTPWISRESAWILDGVSWAGWRAVRAGNGDEASEYAERARLIDPHDARTQALSRAAAGMPDPEVLAAAEARVRENPDDFEAHQALDALWMEHGRAAEVIVMWNEYIARHPDDARAYVERSGTRYQLREYNHAMADLNRACDLGHQEGCDLRAQVELRRSQAEE